MIGASRLRIVQLHLAPNRLLSEALDLQLNSLTKSKRIKMRKNPKVLRNAENSSYNGINNKRIDKAVMLIINAKASPKPDQI